MSVERFAQPTGIEIELMWHDEAMNDGTPGWSLEIDTPDGPFIRHCRRPGPLLDAAELWAAQRGLKINPIVAALYKPGNPDAPPPVRSVA